MGFLNEITRSTVVQRKTGILHGYHFRPAITLYFIMSFATDVTASCSLEALSSLLALCSRATQCHAMVAVALLSRILWIFERKVLQMVLGIGISHGPRISQALLHFVSHEGQCKLKTRVPIKLNWCGSCSSSVRVRCRFNCTLVHDGFLQWDRNTCNMVIH